MHIIEGVPLLPMNDAVTDSESQTFAGVIDGRREHQTASDQHQVVSESIVFHDDNTHWLSRT